jgi:hypothetical protein
MLEEDDEHGAGFAVKRADEVARLSAGILSDDDFAIRSAISALDEEHERGLIPCGGEVVRKRIEPLLAEAFSAAVSACALARGAAGDLEVSTPDGTHRVEIKAQLDKAKSAELTQADWVRNETDVLRYLCLHDPDFAARLSARNRGDLASDHGYFDGWSFVDLWLADVAGMTSLYARIENGVRTPTDLRAFLGRKHLLHLCQERDALLPLLSIEKIAIAVANPAAVEYALKVNKASEIAVQIRVGGGKPVFTYHVYPPGYLAIDGFVGRHKLHGTALPGAR